MVMNYAHTRAHASKHAGTGLQLRRAVAFITAFVLAFSLFPAYAFAATEDDTQTTAALSLSTSATTVSPSGETISMGIEPLNLIQNGNYSQTSSAAITSTYAGTAGVTVPTVAQRNELKALLSAALTKVSYSYYNGSSNWCVLDVSELEAPMLVNASTYTKELLEEVINENPDLFYAGASYGAGTKTVQSGGTTKVVLSKVLVQYYFSPGSIPSMKTRYESAMQQVLSWVPSSGSQAEKAKAVHDWLVRNASYNMNAYYAGGPTGYGSWNPWSAYGAIVDKKPVCEGYSLAFIAAMKRLGIQATFVQNNGHGWNRVKVDGYWYNIDITYDDPIPDRGFGNTPSTSYFLKSDSRFRSMDATHARWTPAGVAGTSTRYDNGWTGGVYSGAYSRTVSSLTLSPASITLGLGASRQLTLKATGTNALPALATWRSSNTSIATVTSSGLVTAGSTRGSATITATLGGKSARCTVTVSSASSIDAAVVSITSSAANLTYVSGVPRKPTVRVTLKGTVLSPSSDYTVSYPSDSINPGTKTAIVVGKGDYAGSKSFTYRITGSLSSVGKSGAGWNNSAATLTVNYAGAKTKKAPTLTFKGSLGKNVTLVEGTDYTVTLSPNSTTPGTKTAVIRGKGAWTGTYSYKLVVKAGSLSSAKVASITKTYTGKALKPAPTVKINGGTISSTYYTVTYKNNKNVGTATMIIKGRNGMTGTIKKTFSIVPKATSISKLAAAKKAFTVTWKKQATQTTGYQVQYSTKSNFSTKKTITVASAKTLSKKVTGLSAKKKYYVRVRTYKKIGSKVYYSNWSAKKAITTK